MPQVEDMADLFRFDERTQTNFETSPLPFAIYQFLDQKVNTLLVSDGLCRLMRLSREKLTERFQKDMYCKVETGDALRIAQTALRFAADECEYNVIYRETLGKDQEPSIIHAVGHHVYTKDGTRLAVVAYDNITGALDETERVQAVFESTVRQFYEDAEVAISIVDQEGDVLLYTNRAFERILPPLSIYDSGITYWKYFFNDDNPPQEHVLAGHCGRGRFIAEDPWHQHPVVMSIREVLWGGKKSFLIRVEDLDKVYLDPLTGLANQDYVDLTAADHIAGTFASGRKPVCIFYDIANMKMFNAQNGYEKGDQLLKEVAKNLAKVFSNSLQARLYADHFCLITSDENLEEKLQKMEAETKLLGGRSKIEINAGVRIVEEGEPLEITALLDQAKTACDSIRNNAERHYCFFDAQMAKVLQDQKYVIDHIDEAIANREIQVYYQPVIRSLSRELCGFEALSRWISPELGFLPPYQFISALEQSHQIHKLDCYVIEEICRSYEVGASKGVNMVPVSMNLSRLDFQMCDIFAYVQSMTDKYQVPHNMLCIEITETVFIEDDGRIIEAIERFQEAGYEVWMDDFGSGYSSLNSLKDYQFNKLKIDMAFLSSFTEKSKKIILAIVQMAKMIGVHTLAEGVETEEQFAFLNSIGCEQVQGYYFGKPLPLLECLAHLAEKGLPNETPEQARYISSAGSTMFNYREPSSILELCGNKFRFLLVNESYQELWRQIGIPTAEDTLEMINDEEGLFYKTVRRRIRQAEENEGHLLFTFLYKNNYMTMTMDILGKREDHMLLKLTLSNTVIAGMLTGDSITGEEQSEAEAQDTVSYYRKQMYRDSLTDLYNRKYLDEQLMDLTCTTVVMADIDHFKEVNDTMGHLCGDLAISEVAKVLRANLRSSDKVVRYGGDEFTIVFDNIPVDVLDRKLQDMREQVCDIILPDYPEIRLSMSFGAFIGEGTVSELLPEADKALYESKKQRNKVTIAQ